MGARPPADRTLFGTVRPHAPVAQSAEAGDLKSPQSGFESLRGHPFSGRYFPETTRIALSPRYLMGRKIAQKSHNFCSPCVIEGSRNSV